MPLEVGTIVEGKVKSIAPFGAFVELGEGKTGLVHISEISTEYVKNIEDHIKQNDVVKVMILSVDEKGKINLSIKKAMEKLPKSSKPAEVSFAKPKAALGFEDMMAKFKQESDEKMQSLKIGKEPRRNRYNQQQ